MDYSCDVCDKYIKPKSKYKLFKSNVHEKIDKFKLILLSFKNIDIKDVDEALFIQY